MFFVFAESVREKGIGQMAFYNDTTAREEEHEDEK